MRDNQTFTLRLEGRIDANNAAQIEQTLLAAIGDRTAGTGTLILDASALKYISSAGLRILMKLRKRFGEDIRIVNVSAEVYDIFHVTGFTEIFTVEKSFRTLSVEGCKVIGSGFYGTVYRVDAETVVKVYNTPDSLSIIRNEQHLAKRAFVKGVPTAISYDIVKVGDCFGSVFELLNADTFNDILIRQPERFDEILRRYAEFLKTVHAAEMDADTIPMARDVFAGYLDTIRDYVTAVQNERLHALLSALPDDLHIIHGDFQMKNVMLVGEEPMLIDMETIATGQPIFDLQALYVTYILFGEDDPDNLRSFLGIPNDWGERIWQRILTEYFETTDSSRLAEINDKIRLLASVRFLYMLASTDLKEGELGKKRIARTQKHIAELTETVGSLVI